MKTITLAIALLISTSAIAQPYIGLSVHNSGVGAQLGILAESIDVALAIKAPLTKVDVPTIVSLTVGKQFLLTQREEDNYSFTISAGAAFTSVKDFTAYNADPTGQTGIATVTSTSIIYGLQVGKDAYLGRVFISANYCKGMYYGLGMRIFFNRN